MAVTSPLKVGGRVLGRFLGNTVSASAGFAAGTAIGPALGPVIQAIRNTVNSSYAYVYPEPGTLASGVAQGQVKEKDARLWASYHGVGDDAFSALVNIANTGPGIPAAFDLWRRGIIEEAAFRRAAKRQGIEQEWIDDLVKIKQAVLDPAQLAAAVHRDIVPDPGLLIGEKPGPDRKVPVFPPVPIDALKEAEANGYDKDHLRALVGLQGLPMGSHEAAQAAFRGVITHDDYLAAIAQGNTRNEWAEAIFAQSRQIVTSHDWVELHLRGYITADQMYAGTATHGMSREDTDRLFLVLGRPLAIHQITTGLARGGKFNPLPGEITDPYEAAVHEANIKPSYYELAIANRYSYPSLFQITNLVKGNAIDADTAKDWATKNGLAPEVVDAMYSFWKSQATTAGTPATRSATTRATTAVSKAYIAARKSRADAEAELTLLGVPADQFDALFTAWNVNREATIAAMTNTQIRNAFRNLTITEADAVVRLVDRGLTVEQATAYLTAKPGTTGPGTGTAA